MQNGPLELVAGIIVIFVLAVSTELAILLFRCCKWTHKRVLHFSFTLFKDQPIVHNRIVRNELFYGLRKVRYTLKLSGKKENSFGFEWLVGLSFLFLGEICSNTGKRDVLSPFPLHE